MTSRTGSSSHGLHGRADAGTVTRRAALLALAAAPLTAVALCARDGAASGQQPSDPGAPVPGAAGTAAPGQPSATASATSSTTATAAVTTAGPTGRLLWSDEFDGPAGSTVDPAVWTSESGAGGWGNGELQNYTRSARNASLDGRGSLLITMREEATRDQAGNSSRFTSARIMTRQAFLAGRIEARLRVPSGQGLWAAFWTLGADWPQVGWPRSGEIDVMEHYDDATDVETVVHAAEVDVDGRQLPGRGWKAPGVRAVGDVGAWHDYAVDISSDELSFSVDGVIHQQVRRAELLPGQEWPFDQPQRVLLNLAMARWLPDGQAPALPASLVVDHVRVYARP